MSKKEISELKAVIQELLTKQAELEKRIEVLESKPVDKRFKKGSVHVLGFTLVKNGDYYHAVRTLDGSQYRIYIGKSIDDLQKVESKIEQWFAANPWAKRIKKISKVDSRSKKSGK